MTMLAMLNAAVPVLVTVTVCLALTLFIACWPKARLVLLKLAVVGAVVICPVNPTLTGVAVLRAKVRLAV